MNDVWIRLRREDGGRVYVKYGDIRRLSDDGKKTIVYLNSGGFNDAIECIDSAVGILQVFEKSTAKSVKLS